MSDPAVIEEARRWLRFAREDLCQAESLVAQEQAVYRHACWFAQQAAEKALKAGLVLLQRSFPRTHDLSRLLDLLPTDWSVRTAPVDLPALTEWAVESRYPGDWEEATQTDAESAVGTAQAVVAAVEQGMNLPDA
ncbi:MAG TPA: HEPN domain-containing protein [Phycisphaerae bacterium]|nr:HEPN domain-containing protein [Phycisphaerae bacterium]